MAMVWCGRCIIIYTLTDSERLKNFMRHFMVAVMMALLPARPCGGREERERERGGGRREGEIGEKGREERRRERREGEGEREREGEREERRKERGEKEREGERGERRKRELITRARMDSSHVTRCCDHHRHTLVASWPGIFPGENKAMPSSPTQPP